MGLFSRLAAARPEKAARAGSVVALVVGAVALPLAPVGGQQPNPLGGTPSGTVKPDRQPGARNDSAQTHRAAAARRAAPAQFRGADSVVYHLLPTSRLEAKTGKAGLFGFAGHSHVMRARRFSGQVVYYPKAEARSHLEITILADGLEVVTPPDTAEIRKVTEAMRTEVLNVRQYHKITLVSRAVTTGPDGFHLVGALTLVGRTREVPIDVRVELGLDTLRATGAFSINQTDFGIKPYSGGPAGTVKVADQVTFDLDAFAARTAGSPRVTGRR